MTTEEMNEIKDDMRQEMLQESKQEERIRNDIDYAISCHEVELQEAYETLIGISNKLSKYGYEITARDLLEYV